MPTRLALVTVIVVTALAASSCVLAQFETGMTTCFDQQEAHPDRLRLAPDPDPAQSDSALRVEVQPGDVAIPADNGTGKTRAELHQTRECGDDYPVGTEWYYGWKLFIPDDYPTEAVAFQIVGQFHHRGTGSPQIAVQLGIESGVPVYQIIWRAQLADPPTVLGSAPITLGEWTQFSFRIVWSTDPTVGEIEARIDGVDVIGGTHHGATAYDEQPKALKVGLYRGAGYTSTAVLYYDDLVIGESWELVEL